MKCFIIFLKKIALVAMQSRSARIPGLSLGLRQAKAGVTLGMGQRRTSVASVTQLTCREGWRQLHDPRRRRIIPQKSIGMEWAVAAGGEAVWQQSMNDFQE